MSALYVCALVAWATALARIDFAEHRLPDRLTLPAFPAALGIVAQLWPHNLGESVQWAALVLAGAVTLAVVADLGWGDVKLLGVLGMIAGGSGTVANSAFMVCIGGGLHVLVHLMVDGNKRAHIPFGPALLLGFVPSAFVAL
jgi:leader peptidase (prepilin peptidase)/N-methyltransferase